MLDVRVRQARAEDAPALREIERRTPVLSAWGRVTVDRGEDYFAASRLRGGVDILVAEAEGVGVGFFCGVVHVVALGGKPVRALYIHRARVLPEYQRRGIGRALGVEVWQRYLGRCETAYWYIRRANTVSQRFVRGVPNRWSFGPLMLELDVRALVGTHAGRPCTPGDALDVVRLLNATHEGEEMFLSYTPERLESRLARDPRQYGWEHLRRTEAAVVGVWPEGASAVVQVEREGGVLQYRTAKVVDYGCLPGREEELVALLRAWASELAARGFDTLSLFAWPGAPLEPPLRELAARVEPFDFWTPAIPEPAGARERGLYVDPVYF